MEGKILRRKQEHLGQMFVIRHRARKPKRILITLIGSVLTTSSLLLMLMTTTIVQQQQYQAEAMGLVEVYNKFRPKLSLEHLNSSGSSVVAQIQDQHGSPISRSIEYNSPIKRIMELISQHTPVIVVSSPSNHNNQHPHDHPHNHPQQQQQDEKHSAPLAASLARQQVVHNSGPYIGMPHQPAHHYHQSSSNHFQGSPSFHNSPPQYVSSTANSDRQQWALMETNPIMAGQSLLSASGDSGQADSQPQIISTNGLPFETQQPQYQFHHVTDENGNQITLQVPSQQLSYSNEPSTESQQQFQQLTTYQPESQQTPIFMQHYQQQPQSIQQFQPHQQQQSQNQEERAQPIFLSSYVPEIQMKAGAPAGLSASPLPGIVTLPGQSPGSIQDIQSKVAKQATHSSSGGDSPEGPSEQSGGDDGDNEQPQRPPQDDSENDIEEPQQLVNNNEQSSNGQPDESEEPNNNDSGSITYEDKYDSDKDPEPRPEPASSSNYGLTANKLKKSKSSSSESPKSMPANHKSSDDHSRAEAASGSIVNGLINVGLNDDCLQCICRASSGCDQLLRCITRGSEDKYCGPFQLTEEYWNMAGSPGDASTNFSSFEDCANEADCAVDTVTKYMKKYWRDCDGDQLVTCMDYARLHKLKPDECGDTEKLVNSPDAYWAKFQRCAEGYNRTRTGDDESI